MPVSVGALLAESLPPGDPLPEVTALARSAEKVGLDGIWSSDRLAAGDRTVPDATMTLAAVAAVTSSIEVGFAIYVPSLRPFHWACKQVSTLAYLAGGRLRLGVGLGGGGEQELAGLSLAVRAARTDRFLRHLEELTNKPMSKLPEVPGSAPAWLHPDVSVPPVWIGGHSDAALRRVVRFGHGWLAGLQTAAEFGANVKRLRALCVQAGRPPAATAIGMHAALGSPGSAALSEVTQAAMRSSYGLSAARASELAIAGTPNQVADQLAPYVQAGAELILLVCDPAPSELSIELLAEVRSLLQ